MDTSKKGGDIEMATTVYTESICDKCSMFQKRVGAEGAMPAILWSDVTVHTRLEGSGWTNSKTVTVQLCPLCTEDILNILRRQPIS